MEHREETPRRRRTKRGNETRERDFTGSETYRSDARRRRIRRGHYEKKVRAEAVESSDDADESSDDESDDEDPSTIASSAAPPPPGTATLSPPPPPPVATPPSATVTPPPAETGNPAAVPLSTAISATLDGQPVPPASTTLDTQTIISATNAPVAAGETTEPPRSQNGQSTVMPPAATTAIAVFGSLAGVSLLAFLFWKLYRRRRGRDEPDESFEKDFPDGGPKSDIRVMDEAMAAVYKAEGGNGNGAPSTRYSGSIPPRDDPSRDGTADDSTPSWLRRQVQRARTAINPGGAGAAAEDDPSPKGAAVSRWMDRHTSRMLDPMAARASVASSGVASLRGLGPVPSVSPASVVGDQRESILSEMGQIRRAAVPPPLDLKMVERVKQMQEDALRPPPPIADRGGNSSPMAMSQAQTETTWNTWGVDQRRK